MGHQHVVGQGDQALGSLLVGFYGGGKLIYAAHSVMRLNEICGLRTTDLKKEKGIWFFDITDAKTEAGDRRVPVHSKIVELGLLEYIKGVKGEWLFPALKPGGPDGKRGWYLTKAFGTRRRVLGVVRPDPKTGKDTIDFHSFRRSAIRCLENARVPQSEAAQVGLAVWAVVEALIERSGE